MVLGLLDQLLIFSVVSDRIARVFNNRSETTEAVALDIFMPFDKVSHAGLLLKLSLMEFQVRYMALFLLFSVIDSFKWFWMASLHKNI